MTEEGEQKTSPMKFNVEAGHYLYFRQPRLIQ